MCQHFNLASCETDPSQGSAIFNEKEAVMIETKVCSMNHTVV